MVDVLSSFPDSGHTVYGLVRKEADAKLLLANEIEPIIGYPSHSLTHSQLTHSLQRALARTGLDCN